MDEKGEKISKSKGNGITIDQWLEYASPESLSLYMYQNPKRAKKLYFDCIPRSMDEYKKHLDNCKSEKDHKFFDNPLWHVHSGNLPEIVYPIEFSALINLVTALNTDEKDTILKFAKMYVKDKLDFSNEKELSKIINLAIAYFEDFILPNLLKKVPNEEEKESISKLILAIENYSESIKAEDYQKIIYNIGKEIYPDSLRLWFISLYEILFGSKNGPRLGSFFFVYGKEKVLKLLKSSIS